MFPPSFGGIFKSPFNLELLALKSLFNLELFPPSFGGIFTVFHTEAECLPTETQCLVLYTRSRGYGAVSFGGLFTLF